MLTLDTPVQTFRHRLEENPIYPFRETDPGIYELTGNYANFYTPLALCCLTVCVTIVYYVIVPFDEYVIFPCLAFLCLAYVAWNQRKRRLYVLDGREYKFYIGDHLHCQSSYHNIYIRLEARKPRLDKTYYRLVFDGYELEGRHLTSYDGSYNRLYEIGRRLAGSLDINFFDYKNRSTKHIIRHQPAPMSDFYHC